MQTEEYRVPILDIHPVTHNVYRIRLEKPQGYHFTPGQATEVSLCLDGFEDERRPFTFTSLNTDPFLEFTIKSYGDHPGVTAQLPRLKKGDELIIRDVWGTIEYKGPGYFIAGGAGITPFLAILRQLHREKSIDGNVLFFSNRTYADIILEQELKEMLGDHCHFILSDEEHKDYPKGFIDKEFLQQHVKNISRNFYLCGPPPMVESMQKILGEMGANTEAVVFER